MIDGAFGQCRDGSLRVRFQTAEGFDDTCGDAWMKRGFPTRRTADGFQTTRNIDSLIELLSFQQPIVSGVKVVAFDIEAG